jgi:uncharacterized protein
MTRTHPAGAAASRARSRTAAVARICEAAGGSTEFLSRMVGQFRLDLDGSHGVDHWLRVLDNGRRLAALTGADAGVVRWFALLHDCCRHSNGSDPEHGPRAAAFAWENRRELGLGEERFDLLLRALSCHTTGCSSMLDVTILTCLDADRLDLARVGVMPSPDHLFTEAARGEARQAAGGESTSFPVRFSCVNCGKKVRAAHPGRFQCPQCRLAMRLDEAGRISFE